MDDKILSAEQFMETMKASYEQANSFGLPHDWNGYVKSLEEHERRLLSQANRREELLREACLSAAKLIPPLQSISDEMADQKNLVLVQLHKALSGEPS